MKTVLINTETLWKSATAYSDIREWRAYVRTNSPADEVDFILARGRTQLFLRFYEIRNLPFPESLLAELQRIEKSASLNRARELEALNERVFADLTQLLFTMQPQTTHNSESVVPTTPIEIIEELEQHLATTNSFFAVWARYQALQHSDVAEESWDDFASRECPSRNAKDLEFTRMMSQLGTLLRLYRERGLPLPPRTRFSMWFLHYVEQPVRNTQTRVLLATLLEGLDTCGSA